MVRKYALAAVGIPLPTEITGTPTVIATLDPTPQGLLVSASREVTQGPGGAGIFSSAGLRVIRDGAGPAITDLFITELTIKASVEAHIIIAFDLADVVDQQRGRFLVGAATDPSTLHEPQTNATFDPLQAGTMTPVVVVRALPANTLLQRKYPEPEVHRGSLAAGEGITVTASATVANTGITVNVSVTWRRF